jgi:putative sigma-54 modulation protein
MKLKIRSRQVQLPTATQQEIWRRIYRVFGRVSPWIREVDLTLSDINGPRGGADKRCQLHIRGRGMAEVVVEQVGLDALAAVALAAARAEQVILRRLARRRAFPRASLRSFSLVPL